MTTPQTNLPSLRASAATLAEAWIPHVNGRAARAARDVALVLGVAGLTAVGAQIAFTLPGYPVPWTFQTFGVLLGGAALGAGRGFLSMLVYLVVGAVGIGVFAEAGGAPTIGYLVGFAVAAALVGRLAERQWDRTRTGAFLQMLLGTLVIYLFGVPFLAALFPMSLSDAIFYGAVVFIPWDIFKVILATFGLPFAWRLAGDRTGE